MVVDDLVVPGAEPLFFLDYVAIERLEPDVVARLVASIARACEQVGCALLGGETAEHPGAMLPGTFDLAGFGVGVVERDALLGPHRVRPGDALVALASSGLHSNGFSLVARDPGPRAADDAFVRELLRADPHLRPRRASRSIARGRGARPVPRHRWRPPRQPAARPARTASAPSSTAPPGRSPTVFRQPPGPGRRPRGRPVAHVQLRRRDGRHRPGPGRRGRRLDRPRRPRVGVRPRRGGLRRRSWRENRAEPGLVRTAENFPALGTFDAGSPWVPRRSCLLVLTFVVAIAEAAPSAAPRDGSMGQLRRVGRAGRWFLRDWGVGQLTRSRRHSTTTTALPPPGACGWSARRSLAAGVRRPSTPRTWPRARRGRGERRPLVGSWTHGLSTTRPRRPLLPGLRGSASRAAVGASSLLRAAAGGRRGGWHPRPRPGRCWSWRGPRSRRVAVAPAATSRSATGSSRSSCWASRCSRRRVAVQSALDAGEVVEDLRDVADRRPRDVIRARGGSTSSKLRTTGLPEPHPRPLLVPTPFGWRQLDIAWPPWWVATDCDGRAYHDGARRARVRWRAPHRPRRHGLVDRHRNVAPHPPAFRRLRARAEPAVRQGRAAAIGAGVIGPIHLPPNAKRLILPTDGPSAVRTCLAPSRVLTSENEPMR